MSFDWRETILSQYSNSPILLALIESFNDAVDPENDIDSFYDNVVNILTAVGWGLDVWGRIVGVSRVLELPSTDYFGFGESSDAKPFGQAPFFIDADHQASTNYILSDDAYRALILIKALSNISNSSIKTYNRILMKLFPGRGNAFVSDTGTMTERLVFTFPLEAFEIAILKQSGAFSAPTGVGFDIMVLDIPTQFGFAEAGASVEGFDVGIFFKDFA